MFYIFQTNAQKMTVVRGDFKDIDALDADSYEGGQKMNNLRERYFCGYPPRHGIENFFMHGISYFSNVKVLPNFS